MADLSAYKAQFPSLQGLSDTEAMLRISDVQKLPITEVADYFNVPMQQSAGLGGDIRNSLKIAAERAPGIATGFLDAVTAPITGHRYFDEGADYAGRLTGIQPAKWANVNSRLYSPETQQAQSNISQAWDQGGAGNIAGAYIANPRALVPLIGENAPTFLAGGLAGKAAKVLSGVDEAASLAAGSKVYNMGRATAAGVGEGAITAGQNMDQTARSADPRMAGIYNLLGGAITAGIGVGAGRFAEAHGLTTPEMAMVGREGTLPVGQAAANPLSTWRRIGGGALTEGVLQEFPQSYQEQVWQNLAENKAWDDGALRQGVEGALVGSLMGGTFNAPRPHVQPAPIDTHNETDLMSREQGKLGLNPLDYDYSTEPRFPLDRANDMRMAQHFTPGQYGAQQPSMYTDATGQGMLDLSGGRVGAMDPRLQSVAGSDVQGSAVVNGQQLSFSPQQMYGWRNPSAPQVNSGAGLSMQDLVARNVGINPVAATDIKGIAGAFEAPAGVTTDPRQQEVPLPAADAAQIAAGVTPDRAMPPPAPSWQDAVHAAYVSDGGKNFKALNQVKQVESPEQAAALIREKFGVAGADKEGPWNAAHQALTGQTVENYDAQQNTQAGQADASSGAQPEVRQEGGGSAEGSAGVQPGGSALTPSTLSYNGKTNPLALLTPARREKVWGWAQDRLDGMTLEEVAAKHGVKPSTISKALSGVGITDERIQAARQGDPGQVHDMQELMASSNNSARETGDTAEAQTGFSEVSNPGEYHVNEAPAKHSTAEERGIAQRNVADTRAADQMMALGTTESDPVARAKLAAQHSDLLARREAAGKASEAERQLRAGIERNAALMEAGESKKETLRDHLPEALHVQDVDIEDAADEWGKDLHAKDPTWHSLLPAEQAAWVVAYVKSFAHSATLAEAMRKNEKGVIKDDARPRTNAAQQSERSAVEPARTEVSEGSARGATEPTGINEPAARPAEATADRAAQSESVREGEPAAGNPIERRAAELRSKLNPAESKRLDGFIQRYTSGDPKFDLNRLKAEIDGLEASAAPKEELNAIRSDGRGAHDAAETQAAIGGARNVGLALRILRGKVDAAWHPLVDKLLANGKVAGTALELTHTDGVSEATGNPILGTYSPSNNIVRLHNGAGFMALLHEVTHARTYDALRTNPQFRAEIQSLYDVAVEKLGKDSAYGLKNLDEFVAEIYGNAWFSDALDALKIGGDSLLDKIIGAIRKLFGLPVEQQSLVDAVVRAVDRAEMNAAPKAAASGALNQEVSQERFAEKPPVEGRTTFMDKMHDFALDLIGDKGKAWGMNFMTMRDLKDTFEKRLPSVGRYVDTVLTMGAKSHAIALEYAKVLESMLSLKKETQNALLDLMTDSTAAGIHPDRPMSDASNKHVTDFAAWSKLNGQWRALGRMPDGQKAQQAYSDARERFAKSWQQRIDLLTKKVESVGMPAKELAAWKAQLADWEQRIQGPYFPLMRHGDWVSVWKSDAYMKAEEDGDAKALASLKSSKNDYKVSFSDSMTAAKRLADQWATAGGKGYSQKKVDFSSANSAVDKVFLARVEETLAATLGNTKEGREAITAMKELYAATLPDMSVMKRTLARRGVDGVNSQDMLRSFSRAGMGDSFYLARLEHADAALDALQDLRKEDSPDNGGDHSVLAHMIKLHRTGMQQVSTPIQAFLANAAHTVMLGASPAYLTINAMQPTMITLPMLAARHNMGASSKALFAAYPDAAKLFKVLWKDQGWRFQIDTESPAVKAMFTNAPHELEMIKTLLDKGIIDIGIENDLRAVSEGQELGTSTFTKAITAPAHYVETINRLTTALAAYRLEMLKTNNDTAARAYAEKITADTQFDYSGVNSPYIMRPGVVPAGRLLFQFRKYQQGVISLLIKQLGAAAKGDKQARSALYGLLATHMTMTGMAGLPVAFPLGVLASMIGAAFGNPDDKQDPEIMWRNYLADFFGTDTARLLQHGVPAALGLDLSQRLGLGNAFAPLPYVQAKGTVSDTYKEAMLNLAPAEGLGTNVARSADAFLHGDMMKGLENLLPKMFADPLKAMQMANEGVNTTRGAPVFSADEVGAGSIALKSLGFQSTKMSEYYSAKTATDDYKMAAQKARTELINDWVKARTTGDSDSLGKVTEDIAAYRERHQGQKGLELTYSGLQKALVDYRNAGVQTDATGIRAGKGEMWKRGMTRFAE